MKKAFLWENTHYSLKFAIFREMVNLQTFQLPLVKRQAKLNNNLLYVSMLFDWRDII